MEFPDPVGVTVIESAFVRVVFASNKVFTSFTKFAELVTFDTVKLISFIFIVIVALPVIWATSKTVSWYWFGCVIVSFSI